MPRTARIKSESGIYHIIMRGINRQILFEDEEDRIRFIETLQRYREICKYKLFAYCLMDNHVHILMMEGEELLEIVMRRICASYVLWYNKKYDRIGYLFQDRFKSEPVENEEYFLTAIRYIFRNPVKADLVSKVEEYKWTNYKDYNIGSKRTDIDFALDILNQSDREEAIIRFKEYVSRNNDDECADVSEKRRLSDYEAMKIIKAYCKIERGTDLQKFDLHKRNSYIKVLKKEYNMSIRQIERLTGISRGIVQKA